MIKLMVTTFCHDLDVYIYTHADCLFVAFFICLRLSSHIDRSLVISDAIQLGSRRLYRPKPLKEPLSLNPKPKPYICLNPEP